MSKKHLFLKFVSEDLTVLSELYNPSILIRCFTVAVISTNVILSAPVRGQLAAQSSIIQIFPDQLLLMTLKAEDIVFTP